MYDIKHGGFTLHGVGDAKCHKGSEQFRHSGSKDVVWNTNRVYFKRLPTIHYFPIYNWKKNRLKDYM